MFISSQLRSFNPVPCYVGRLIYQLPSKSSFTDFLACVKILYYEGGVLADKFISDYNLDPLQYGQSFLLHQVTEQLIKMQKTALWVKELKKLALNDKSVLFYLVDIYIS